MEYTPEQLNYFRICFIAFNLVPQGLREVFKQEWNFRYKTALAGEWQDDAQNGQDFFNKESKKSRCKNARYLATIRNGNSAKWDCSCLFYAILFSDSIGTSLSAAVRYDVDDLRQVRNDIAHISVAELTDAEFQGYVGRLVNAFTSLGLQTSEINSIGIQTSFPTSELNNLESHLKRELQKADDDREKAQENLISARKEVDTLSKEIHSKVECFCNLAVKPSHEVIRRSNEVTKIMNKMKQLGDESNGVVTTIYLSGNPGCGKTQLARQIGEELFATRKCDSESLMFVATLNAESPETLADSYMTFAKEVGVTEYALTNIATLKAIPPEERIQHLKRLVKSKIQKFSTWLIIADNVVDLGLVRSFLPLTASKEWGQGQVLITTQESSTIPRHAPHTYTESLSKGMQPDDAVELLKEVSQLHTEEELQKVAEVLDYQPLALAAAAYYVRTVVAYGSPTYSWTVYLLTLTQGKREVTEETLKMQSDAYSQTMTTAIKLAIRRAVETDEVYRQMFLFFSLCASDAVPLQAVVRFVKERLSNQTEEHVRAKIVQSTLVLCSGDKHESARYLQMHSIVYEVFRMEQTFISNSSERLPDIAAALWVLKSLTPPNTKLSSREECVFVKTIAKHSKALLTNATSCDSGFGGMFLKNLTPFITPDDFVWWLLLLAEFCRELTELTLAKYYIDLAHDLLQYISHTEKGECLKESVLSSLGNVYSGIGLLDQAKEFHEKALMIGKMIYGEEHGHVATSYNNLGTVYSDIGQLDRAKEFHEKALMIGKKIYGEEHGHVATSYNNLGNVYSDIGQLDRAKEFHEKALMIRKIIYGEEHGHVATSYNNLGIVYSDIGQLDQAKKFHEKALMIGIKIYGEEHGAVADSYNNLGNVYSGIGRLNQAKEFHEKALMIRKKIYGEEHGDVARSYNNLGVVCKGIGLLYLAKEFHEKALIIRRKIYGEEHGDVARSYNNLGFVYRDIGQLGQAKKFHEKALVIQKKIYGEKHADVARSYNNLGVVYRDIGQLDQAKKLYVKARTIRKMIHENEHGVNERVTQSSTFCLIL